MKWHVCFAGLLLLGTIGIGCRASNSRVKMSDAEFMQRIREYNQEVEKHDQIHCEKVAPLGSNMLQWVCTKKWSKNAEALRTQEVMRQMQRSIGQSGN